MSEFTAYSWFLSALWALAAAGLAWYCSRVAANITYVTLADGRRQERKLPLSFRVLLPFTPNLVPLFRAPSFDRTRTNTTVNLVAAGFEGLVSAEEFLSLKILMPVVLGPIWCMFVIMMAAGSHAKLLSNMSGWFCALGVLLLAVYPDTWMRKALRERHRSIQRALPFVLDLLTLSVEAGMDFMMAIQRHVERGRVDPLGEELLRVIREIQIGKTRREALRDMSRRVNLPDLRSVVNALVQADELGVSIGSILRIQADQMRQRRFERAEKLANEAPVKMLGPLLFFIFPSVFLILLGPLITSLIQQVM